MDQEHGWRAVHREPVRVRARPAAVGEAVLTPRGVEDAGPDMWVIEASGGQTFLGHRRLVARWAARAPGENGRFGWLTFEIPAATAEARPVAAGEVVETVTGERTAQPDEWLVRGPGGTYLLPGVAFHALYTET
jgi:hypothetical protein